MSFANYQPNQSSFYYILKSTGIAFKRSKRQNTEHFIIYHTVLPGIRLSRHKCIFFTNQKDQSKARVWYKPFQQIRSLLEIQSTSLMSISISCECVYGCEVSWTFWDLTNCKYILYYIVFLFWERGLDVHIEIFHTELTLSYTTV